MSDMPVPLPFDYNDQVFRHGAESRGLDASTLMPAFRDIHTIVADRFAVRGDGPLLDLGCGPTKLGMLLDGHSVPWVGVDAAIKRLQLGNGPRVLGDAGRLPFRDETFGGVAALYMLYHFADPAVPVAEAHRVLRTGGLFAAAAPSRRDSPELEPFLPPRPPDTFDSDMAPELLGRWFEIAWVDTWDMPLYRFTAKESLWDYLIATNTVSQPNVATEIAASVRYPFWLTKRGATVWGRKR